MQPNNLVSFKWPVVSDYMLVLGDRVERLSCRKTSLGLAKEEAQSLCWKKKNNLQMSAEGRRALTVAGQSSVTAYTTRGDNYTGWVSIACVCSSLSVVPQESLWVCM